MLNLYYVIPSVLLISIISGVLSCFVLWRSTEYFADAMSHALMIGAAIAIAININQTIIMSVMSIFLALVVVFFSNSMHCENLVVSILSNGLMAFSIALVFFLKGPGSHESFDDFLLGEIETLGMIELFIIICISLTALFMLCMRWEKWLLISVNKELSLVEIPNKKHLDIEYYLLISVFIAIAIKIVGILLVVSILTMPAAIARFYSKNTFSMVLIAASFSAFAALLGVLCEHIYKVPFATIIVSIEFVLFVLSAILHKSYNI